MATARDASTDSEVRSRRDALDHLPEDTGLHRAVTEHGHHDGSLGLVTNGDWRKESSEGAPLSVAGRSLGELGVRAEELIARRELDLKEARALLASVLADEPLPDLDEPICRVTAPPTPVPAAANLEDAYMADAEQISRAVTGLVPG